MPWRTTLKSTVKVTVAIAGRDLRSGLAELLDGQEGEHDRREASRPEPADEHDTRPIEPRSDQAHDDREHAHDRQAGDGVHDH